MRTFINEVSEDIAKLKGRVDGLEAQQNNFEAGAFSSTTSMDGKAAFWIGAYDGGDAIGDTENVETDSLSLESTLVAPSIAPIQKAALPSMEVVLEKAPASKLFC